MQTISFEKGKIGVECENWKTGVVTSIEPDSPAHLQGVMVGWQMVQVNDRRFSKRNLAHFEYKLKPFSVTFNMSPRVINKNEIKRTPVTFFLFNLNLLL